MMYLLFLSSVLPCSSAADFQLSSPGYLVSDYQTRLCHSCNALTWKNSVAREKKIWYMRSMRERTHSKDIQRLPDTSSHAQLSSRVIKERPWRRRFDDLYRTS